MSTDAVGTQETPLYPPTGEPIGEIARRTKVGLWTLIVMSVSGTLALVVSYSYLWALNVNGGWAPPGASLTSSQTNSTLPSKSDATFAPEWPFWAIFGLTVLATIAMWFGYKQLVKGHRDGMLLGIGPTSRTLCIWPGMPPPLPGAEAGAWAGGGHGRAHGAAAQVRKAAGGAGRAQGPRRGGEHQEPFRIFR